MRDHALKMGRHHFLRYHKHSDERERWDGITKTGEKWARFWDEVFDWRVFVFEKWDSIDQEVDF